MASNSELLDQILQLKQENTKITQIQIAQKLNTTRSKVFTLLKNHHEQQQQQQSVKDTTLAVLTNAASTSEAKSEESEQSDEDDSETDEQQTLQDKSSDTIVLQTQLQDQAKNDIKQINIKNEKLQGLDEPEIIQLQKEQPVVLKSVQRKDQQQILDKIDQSFVSQKSILSNRCQVKINKQFARHERSEQLNKSELRVVNNSILQKQYQSNDHLNEAEIQYRLGLIIKIRCYINNFEEQLQPIYGQNKKIFISKLCALQTKRLEILIQEIRFELQCNQTNILSNQLFNNAINGAEQALFQISKGKINVIGGYKQLENDQDFQNILKSVICENSDLIAKYGQPLNMMGLKLIQQYYMFYKQKQMQSELEQKLNDQKVSESFCQKFQDI